MLGAKGWPAQENYEENTKILSAFPISNIRTGILEYLVHIYIPGILIDTWYEYDTEW